ncbi:MAG: DUF1593 domain-containing protein, partial [bacterium]|nr:DUF1593 domain-containing protein [bacterium]
KTIAAEHPDRIAEVSKKARIYLITEQDNTLKTYIRPEWPGIQVLRSGGPSFGAIAYRWQKIQPKDTQLYFDKEWMASNMLKEHGPLCAMYEAKDGRFRSEGDTPAFLHVIDTGLRSAEHPSHGGWGGRFAFSHNVWKSVDTEDSSPHSILRWAKDFQNDWAARADWCVKAYDDANHPPDVVLSQPHRLEGKPGGRIKLGAGGSTDPDGDALRFNWWLYAEAGSYHGAPAIESPSTADAVLLIPEDAVSGDSLHVVCTVSEVGEPSLTRYARVVVEVKE